MESDKDIVGYGAKGSPVTHKEFMEDLNLVLQHT